jgi:hypothetical protein
LAAFRNFYDHGKPWVTHCSIQHNDLLKVPEWMQQYGKPVVVDECGYEGDVLRRWGTLSFINHHLVGFFEGLLTC